MGMSRGLARREMKAGRIAQGIILRRICRVGNAGAIAVQDRFTNRRSMLSFPLSFGCSHRPLAPSGG